MTTLLEAREWLKRTYGKFSIYIDAAIRFVTGLVIFMMITYRMGYMTRLHNPVIPLLLALVGTFLPMAIIVVMAILLSLVHLYALSLEIAAGMLVIYLILYLIYYRFAPKYSFVLLLTIVAFAWKIPYVMPIVFGLVAAPVVIVPISFGSVIYHLLFYIAQYGTNLSVTTAGGSSSVQQYAYVFTNALKDPAMYLYIVAFAIVLLVVYFVRRSSMDQSWVVAIFSGAVLELVLLLAGNFALDISISMVGLIVGTIVAILLAFVVQFFVFHVDYARTEYVQFEDDEYYCYVKAVPKVTITKREKTVKRINPQKKVRSRIKPEEIL